MNCKPGDRAFIIHALGSENGTGANIGLLCRVLGPVGMRRTAIGKLFHWKIEIIGTSGKDSEGLPTKIGMFPDKYLRPLQADFKQDSVERKETVKA